MIASMGNLGAALGFPVGLIYERLFAQKTFLLSSMLTVLPALMLFSSTYVVSFYQNHWYFLVFYWFLYGTYSFNMEPFI